MSALGSYSIEYECGYSYSEPMVFESIEDISAIDEGTRSEILEKAEQGHNKNCKPCRRAKRGRQLRTLGLVAVSIFVGWVLGQIIPI